MNHNKELKLITDLLNAGIINKDEVQKAELYLSLSSRTFDTHHDAIDWLIQNRAVGRERQDQVRDAFSKTKFAVSQSDAPSATKITHSVPHVNTLEKTVAQPQQRPTYKANVQSASPLTNIYNYNLKQLELLVNKEPDLSAHKQTAQENLKDCPYLFCDFDDLEDWIESDYAEPVSLNDPEEIIDTTTALQLYSLFQKGLIAPDEYMDCYFHLIYDAQAELINLPFRSEDALLNNLIENNCLHHSLTDRNAIRNYNRNISFVDKLIEQKSLNNDQRAVLKMLLAAKPDRQFNHPQQLLEWFKAQQFTKAAAPTAKGKTTSNKKKREFPLLFKIIFAYVLYRIVLGIFSSDKEPHKPVVLPSPKPPAVSQVNCNDNRIIDALKRKLTMEMNLAKVQQKVSEQAELAQLGNLQSFSQHKSLMGDVCKTSAVFRNGSADITFTKRIGNSGIVSITEVSYSNIHLTNAAPEKTPQTTSRQQPVTEVEITKPDSVEVEEITIASTETDNTANAKTDNITNSTQGGTVSSAKNIATDLTKNEYEILVFQSIADIDRQMQEKQPEALKLTDIITDAKSTGRCRQQSNSDIVTCPFTLYYKDIWKNKSTARNYKVNVKFISQNNQLKLEPQTDFLEQLMNEMRYEPMVLKHIDDLDRQKQLKDPGSPKLADIISDVKISRQCVQQSRSDAVICPFTIYYKNVWKNNSTSRSHGANIKFISKNNQISIELLNDFHQRLTDEMRYETIVLQHINALDRQMQLEQPGSLKLADIITDVKLGNQCTQQSRNGLILCTFTVYYKDIWKNKSTDRNYKVVIKFISQNNQLKLQSPTDFVQGLMNEMRLETIVLQNIDDIDRQKQLKEPGAQKLTDIITDVKLINQCIQQTRSDTFTCSFTVYYKDVWRNRSASKNYIIKVKFISQDNQLKLESQADFLQTLMDGMVKDYKTR